MTSRKMFFCYERTMTGRWEPVVYYDEPPKASSQGKECTPTRSNIWEVPEAYKEGDEPLFAALTRKFPSP